MAETVHSISNLKTWKEKIERYIVDVYPYLDRLVFDLLKFQIDNGADIIVAPSVPITSRSFATKQIEKASRMNADSKALMDTIFSSQSKQRDFLIMLTVNAGILDSDFVDPIFGMLRRYEPDHIGIKLLNLNPSDSVRVESTLRFISDLRKALQIEGANIPIHIFNVREFGYVTYCHGATSIVSPIATTPYIYLDRENPPDPIPLGRYYHPIDMTDDTFELLCEKTMQENFRLPCHCKICEEVLTVPNVKDNFNRFRKVHFILAKNLEMKEIRFVEESVLHIGLKNRFANSKSMTWVPYLDRMIAPFTH